MEQNIEEIIEKSKSLSDLSKNIFGKENYTNREKCKKILFEHNIDWKEWCSTKRKKQKQYCLYCGKELTGDYRKKFCNHSCAASYNNMGVVRNGSESENSYCLNCGKELDKYCKKYCCKECESEYRYKQSVEKWKSGSDEGWTGHGAGIKPFIKRYLMAKYDCKCQKCGWGEINESTGSSPLQVHHIDGNCKNNSEENLQLLCPNCHSLTDTFGRLNNKSNRKR